MERESALLLRQISGHMLNALNDAIAASDRLATKLGKQSVDSATAEQLAALRHNQFRVLRTAQNMHVLSSLVLDEEPLHFAAADLNEFCETLMHTVFTLVDGVDLCFIPASVSCLTVCDTRRLRTMLLNLLDNSLLHCKAGDRVELRLTRVEEQFCLTLWDNGSGIPLERMDTVFQDYLRQPELPDPEQGAGLGLSVAEAIVKAHGGTLLLSSLPQEGTRAVITLPCRSNMAFHSYQSTYGTGMRDILAALSDVLDSHKFCPIFF